MASYRAKLALLLVATIAPGSPAFGDEPGGGRPPEKTPELEIAASAAKKLDRDEASWQELTTKLRKAVEQYHPDTVFVLPEREPLDAFRGYCGKLLESGQNLVALHEKWDKASDALGDSLKKAPAYYRGAAKAMRDKAGATQFEVIKERYLLTADIWDQLATRAERRAKELGVDRAGNRVVALVREENTFLTDFIGTLDALPRASGEDNGRYGDLVEAFRKHATHSHELLGQLKRFRDKLTADPRDGTPAK